MLMRSILLLGGVLLISGCASGEKSKVDAGGSHDAEPGDVGDAGPGDARDAKPGDPDDAEPDDARDANPGDPPDAEPDDAREAEPGDSGDAEPGNAGDSGDASGNSGESGSPSEPKIDWCVLHAPASGSIAEGESLTVYGRVFVNGLTDPAGMAADIDAQVGYGPKNSNGSTSGAWQWTNANYNPSGLDVGKNDEYMGDITPAAGEYNYAYRFRYKGGNWTFCDLDSSDNGYSAAQQGTLVVDSAGSAEPWRRTNPLISNVENAGSKFRVTADIRINGVTDSPGQGAGITAQIGFGIKGSAPSSWSTWVSASYQGDNSTFIDRYGATLTAAAAGEYDIAARFTVGGNTYYADVVSLKTFAGQDSSIHWCDVQWPTAGSASPGGTIIRNGPLTTDPPLGDSVYGRIFKAGVTNVSGNAGSISAQLGIGKGTPLTDDWTWTAASHNAGCSGCGSNYEFMAPFTAPSAPGSYRFVYRFRSDAGWTYCGVDPGTTDADFDANTCGALNVTSY